MNTNYSGLLGQKIKDRFGRFGDSEIFSGIMGSPPRALQHHRRIDGELMDLATLDVLRDRERGVPRYNDFREEMRMPRVRSFDELTDNREWAEQLRRVSARASGARITLEHEVVTAPPRRPPASSPLTTTQLSGSVGVVRPTKGHAVALAPKAPGRGQVR